MRTGPPTPAGLGVIVPTADESLVELLARGADVVVLDLEHGSISDREASTAVGLAHALNTPVMARVPSGEGSRVQRFLDAGGDGIVAAHVESASDVEAWRELLLPPPLGRRGVSATRVTGYGSRSHPLPPVWFCPQVETAGAVRDLDRIAAVPGVCALMVGPRDLSHMLGVPGETTHPAVADVCTRVAAACFEHGVDYVAPHGTPPAGHTPYLTVAALPTLVDRGIEGLRHQGSKRN